MATQTINISLPEELVSQVDKMARSEFTNRSEFIRQAVVRKLKADRNANDDWIVLEAMMTDAGIAAGERGYVTDDDFARAVKEVRKEYLAEKEDR
jgi:Arc/MetJ-type ribon-helix-helix transcriptional regulator